MPKVSVALPVKGTVVLYLQATGNSAAINTGNLVARVPAFCREHQLQGRRPGEGQVLFTIEPESYKLKLDQSQAAEDSARAMLKQNEADFERQKNLVKTNAVSQSAYGASLAARENARSNLR